MDYYTVTAKRRFRCQRSARSVLALALIASVCTARAATSSDLLAEEAQDTAASIEALSATTLVGKVRAYATTTGSSGAQQTFGPGVYRANAGQMSGVGNDATRLLELGPAMRVTACQHESLVETSCQYFENLTGANRTFRVAPGVSRLMVRALVVGYRDANFSGVSQGFEVGRYEVGKGDFARIGNDTISSIRMAPGLQLRLCSDNPETTTGGSCGIYAGSVASLPSNLNDRASWLEIRPVTVAYRNPALTGTSQRFGAGVYTAAQLNIVGNDTISSLAVNEGIVTRICSDNPNTTTGGACGTFSNSALTLSSTLDNRTSYIENKHTVILQPINERFFGGDQVTLRGYAVDPEDGPLPGSRLRWYSSRDGFLGTGNVLSAHLSTEDSNCGSGGALSALHLISLVATDAQGHRTTTTRVYRILIIC